MLSVLPFGTSFPLFSCIIVMRIPPKRKERISKYPLLNLKISLFFICFFRFCLRLRFLVFFFRRLLLDQPSHPWKSNDYLKQIAVKIKLKRSSLKLRQIFRDGKAKSASLCTP